MRGLGWFRDQPGVPKWSLKLDYNGLGRQGDQQRIPTRSAIFFSSWKSKQLATWFPVHTPTNAHMIVELFQPVLEFNCLQMNSLWNRSLNSFPSKMPEPNLHSGEM